MLKIPAALEKKLTALFPRAKDREHYVAGLIADALEGKNLPEPDLPVSIGGTLHLFTDGGSRGNPGAAAIAYIVEDPARGVILEEEGKCIGTETNNVAEYRALIEGLRACMKYRPNLLVAHLDSELVVKQLAGEYRVKMVSLQELFDEIRALEAQFAKVRYKHIPRGDNYKADALVNKALDAASPRRYGR